jgi:hypothetical protein
MNNTTTKLCQRREVLPKCVQTVAVLICLVVAPIASGKGKPNGGGAVNLIVNFDAAGGTGLDNFEQIDYRHEGGGGILAQINSSGGQLTFLLRVPTPRCKSIFPLDTSVGFATTAFPTAIPPPQEVIACVP